MVATNQPRAFVMSRVVGSVWNRTLDIDANNKWRERIKRWRDEERPGKTYKARDIKAWPPLSALIILAALPIYIRTDPGKLTHSLPIYVRINSMQPGRRGRERDGKFIATRMYYAPASVRSSLLSKVSDKVKIFSLFLLS